MFTGDEFNRVLLGTTWMAYDKSNGRATYGHTDPRARHIYAASQVTVDGSKLNIRATKRADGQWLSGFVGSRERGNYLPLFGTIAARIAAPSAPGIWPAFWLRHRWGASTCEVDVFERFHTGGDSASIHLHLPKGPGYNVFGEGLVFANPTAMHTYWVRIQPAGNGGVRWVFGVDGTHAGEYLASTSAAAPVLNVDPGAAWDVALNVAVTDNADSGDCDKARSPQLMTVDWVRHAPLPTVALINLRFGRTHPDVADLQNALIAHGFDPGPVDGVYGTRTDTAVRAHQASQGWTPDAAGKSYIGPKQASVLGLLVT